MPECTHADQIQDVQPHTQGCVAVGWGERTPLRSLEPGESWGWCFVDEVELDFA